MHMHEHGTKSDKSEQQIIAEFKLSHIVQDTKMFTSRVVDQSGLRVSEYPERNPDISPCVYRHALMKYRNMIDRNMRLSVLPTQTKASVSA